MMKLNENRALLTYSIGFATIVTLLAAFGLWVAGMVFGVPALRDLGVAGLKVGSVTAGVTLMILLLRRRVWQRFWRARSFIQAHRAGEYGAGCALCRQRGIALPDTMSGDKQEVIGAVMVIHVRKVLWTRTWVTGIIQVQRHQPASLVRARYRRHFPLRWEVAQGYLF